jgi:hypothetical protein
MTIRHNGFTFPLRTYENKALRVLHLWRIEAELRQAIGRARPYSTSGSVTLLSSLPLPEAEVRMERQILDAVRTQPQTAASNTLFQGTLTQETIDDRTEANIVNQNRVHSQRLQQSKADNEPIPQSVQFERLPPGSEVVKVRVLQG